MQSEPGASVAALSSGDLVADRRYQYAMALAARGDRDAAIELLAQTLALAPGFTGGWFSLGDLLAQAGERSRAIAAFAQARAADPADRAGAGLRLALLGAADATAGMPTAYVRGLFDQYAPAFDRALARLAYCGPDLLRAAIERVCACDGRPLRFSTGLDLGCGTGQAGEAFRSFIAHLTGVDLSPGMIEQARAKNIYERLALAELLSFLAGEAQRGRDYDLILAADVLPYLSDLGPVLAAAARVLAPRGLFAFTAETHPGDGVVLGEKLRFAHGAAHIRAALRGARLEPVEFAIAAARTEATVPAPGLVVVCARVGERGPGRDEQSPGGHAEQDSTRG